MPQPFFTPITQTCWYPHLSFSIDNQYFFFFFLKKILYFIIVNVLESVYRLPSLSTVFDDKSQDSWITWITWHLQLSWLAGSQNLFRTECLWSQMTAYRLFFTPGPPSNSHQEEYFRKCVPPFPRFLTLEDTHDLCVYCLEDGYAWECMRVLNVPIVRNSQWESSIYVNPYSRGM